MRRLWFLLSIYILCLSACGYKGDLYLPKEKDNAHFGVWQTGIGLEPINDKSIPNKPEYE
ncbi:LPS translocon maturation chaperone LptM [Stenoxybacter acetivorans]|uniref:LPS translocon maturation chaperone LptM n=1 Tax=Stenoxybacter acetivorans TaxID=422441 RepID=UPI00056D530E|nr:lipoprotein [Stenoxybacter acetivorans]